MTARIHARLLDAAGTALLSAAMLVPMCAGGAAAGSSGPFLQAPPVISDAAREAAYETLWENLQVAVGDQKRAGTGPWEAAPAAKGDEAIVYLVSNYDDGTFLTGSGTIIRGNDGQGRVLTAGHAAALEVMDEGHVMRLQEIFAFSSDGRLMASLFPKVTGYDGLNPPDIDTVTALDISSDIAVLEADYFISPDAEADWKRRGARIAPVQPSAIMAIAPGEGSAVSNSGVSGASLRNGDGEVVGLISYLYHPDTALFVESGSAYLERVAGAFETDGDPLSMSGIVAGLLEDTAEPDRFDRRRGGVGMGTPILQAEILEALHASPVTADTNADRFYAQMAGFPDHELRTAIVIAAELERHMAADRLDPGAMTAFHENPLAGPQAPMLADAGDRDSAPSGF